MPSTPPRQLGRALLGALRLKEKMRWTWETSGYVAVWLLLLAIGLHQQINMVLLIAGLAAGPLVASWFVSSAMLKRLSIRRRYSTYVFSGEPMTIEYVLENARRWRQALAIHLEDSLVPDQTGSSEARELSPVLFFPKVEGRSRQRRSWRGTAPARGRYRFRPIEVATRSPFGLLERRTSIDAPGSLLVYPKIGVLTKRWRLVFREATETRRGRRHDRTAQQQEYHGLREYRPGDSPRWIHWRTTARIGTPMVKEFEQQSEQDLVLLLDPWLPRTKVTAEHREAVEKAIGFCATVCYETCRHQGRRLLVGWSGSAPGLVKGPASIRLLHETLEALAVLRSTSEGSIGGLLDALPPPSLRDALIVIVSTRPVQLTEEMGRSSRFSDTSVFRLTGRTIMLDAARGDLDDFIRYDRDSREAAARSVPEADARPGAGAPPPASEAHARPPETPLPAELIPSPSPVEGQEALS